jgi:hypothetical protein
MAPKNKAKAAGVSASSFMDLQAELAKQTEAFVKAKAAGKANAPTTIFGGEKKVIHTCLYGHFRLSLIG